MCTFVPAVLYASLPKAIIHDKITVQCSSCLLMSVTLAAVCWWCVWWNVSVGADCWSIWLSQCWCASTTSCRTRRPCGSTAWRSNPIFSSTRRSAHVEDLLKGLIIMILIIEVFIKLDPNTWKVQNNAIYLDKTQHVNFGGNPLYQATKWHLNNN